MKPHRQVRGAYLEAFARIVQRVAAKLAGTDRRHLPLRMYVAGGAALHLTAGGRVSDDVDAVFSRRVALGEDIEVSYRDADGHARLLYLDRSYNDTRGLLHEDAYADSRPLALPGLDSRLVEVRVLSPLDLAVSKLARFTQDDRGDIELLAREGLIDAKRLRARAEEALGGCVGDLDAVRNSIDIACRLVDGVCEPSSR